MSPVFAWISERTDQIINKTDYPFNMSQFFTDIWYGIVIALRNFLFELTVIILVMIATIIPIINIISGLPATIFLFIISAYFYGFSYIHYNLERRKFNAKESITFIKKHKGIAIANGMLFSLSLFIPFLGVMLSGITAIIATVGATIAINNIENIDDFKKIEEPKHKSTTNFKPLETNNKVLSNCTGRFVNYK
jgi:CysZ protein